MTDIEKLQQLIETGQIENIELAFELAESQNVNIEELLEPAKEVFESLLNSNQIDSKILDKNAIIEMSNMNYCSGEPETRYVEQSAKSYQDLKHLIGKKIITLEF